MDAFQRGVNRVPQIRRVLRPIVERPRQPRGDFGVDGVQCQHLFRPKIVALGLVNVEQIVVAELEHQRPCAIGRAQRKGRMLHQASNLGNIRSAGRRLQAEPAVDNQRVVLPALVKIIQRGPAWRFIFQLQQSIQTCQPVGQIVRLFVLALCQRLCLRMPGGSKIRQGQIFQRPFAGANGVGLIACLILFPVVRVQPIIHQRRAQLLAQRLSGLRHLSVANPRDSYGYHCGLRLAAHPEP